MNLLRKIVSSFFCMAVLMTLLQFFNAKDKPPGGNLIIQFENFVGDDILKLDSAIYKNNLNQTYTISKFKYYISDIHLKNKNGNEYISKDYYLLSEEEKDSKRLVLNVPGGEYIALSYIVGVDSLHNCSGLQSGALDPVNGMFWAWNSGYVFLKLDGHCPDSKSSGNIFEFHIGGYRQPHNCIRKISLEVRNLKIENRKVSLIKIKADAAEILKTPVNIDFSKLSSVTDLHNATTIADNYVDMFSVLEVK